MKQILSLLFCAYTLFGFGQNMSDGNDARKKSIDEILKITNKQILKDVYGFYR